MAASSSSNAFTIINNGEEEFSDENENENEIYFGDDIPILSSERDEENHDQYLSPVDLEEMRENTIEGNREDWNDILISTEDESCEFHIDKSKDYAWELCKNEYRHVKVQICKMIQEDQQRSNFSRQQNNNQDFIPEFDDIVNIMFGPSSQIANKFLLLKHQILMNVIEMILKMKYMISNQI